MIGNIDKIGPFLKDSQFMINQSVCMGIYI